MHNRNTPLNLGALTVASLALSLLAGSAQAETHWNLPAVTATGSSAWTPSYPFAVVGILLTDPEEMLDSAPNFQPASAGTMGGEWQIVVQAARPGDRGGTICWMGQNYALRRPPGDDSFSYSNEVWLAEVARLNHDPATGLLLLNGEPAGDYALWVPTNFPNLKRDSGKFYTKPTECPVRWVIWSLGPHPKSAKSQSSHAPMSELTWYRHAGGDGVIVRFATREGVQFKSP